MTAIEFVCPGCGGELARCGDGWQCRKEGIVFRTGEGTANFILPERRKAVEEFLAAYRRVRSQEGWGSSSDDYYRDLPYRDRSGRQSRIWRIRTRTFDSFLRHLGRPAGGRRVLDIGAGNGWLSARLAERGFEAVALDINPDPEDGLGALGRTPGGARVLPVRAEFDALPFAPGTFDIAVFNASLHYSRDIPRTLEKAVTTVREDGTVYILDSPLYRDAGSGRAMVRERERRYAAQFGIQPAADRGGGFMTFEQVARIKELHRVEELRPGYGIRWRMRPIVARLLGRREAATFEIIVIRKRQNKEEIDN